MIPYDSWVIVWSVTFYILAKFLCVLRSGSLAVLSAPMYKKQHHLSSIPEHLEHDTEEEDTKLHKWVPKKKHDVLKAKYKCLKKLFQIYDASVIGILPETFGEGEGEGEGQEEERWRGERRHARRRRSHRTNTKADVPACVGTSPEPGSGDVPPPRPADSQHGSIASAVMRDLHLHCSCSTQIMSDKSTDKQSEDYEMKLPSVDSLRDASCSPLQLGAPPYLPRPTRFQAFVQRLFGIRRDRPRYAADDRGHIYAASDNNIVSCKRRRCGLRFRRLRKVKKAQSEIGLADLRSPVILSYVQSVQRNCLMDRTPRQCPIAGCKNMFYGIINYNDHLNLCHFAERRFVCHYCHEGFESELDKQSHEYEHLGISKLQHQPVVSASSTLRPLKASNTQTDPELSNDVPEDKLKKIVSFFDKIVDTEQMLTELKDNRYSESNLRSADSSLAGSRPTGSGSGSASGQRAVSCGDLLRAPPPPARGPAGAGGGARCHVCGEEFTYRRQLSLHVELEHGIHDKFSKFHSCAGIVDCRRRRSDLVKAETGKIKIQSIGDVHRVATCSTLTPDSCSEAPRPQITRNKSEDTMSCDPSTNIVYYESTTSVPQRQPSAASTLVERVRRGVANYRWEPGTKIIRV